MAYPYSDYRKCAHLSCLIGLLLLLSCSSGGTNFQPGDIVFQSLDSPRADAISMATGSKYTHCGLVVESEDGVLMVCEAVQQVRIIPLEQWISQGIDGKYLVMRPSDYHLISNDELLAMLDEARSLQGTSYDNAFSWSDDQMYCSELVWKIYDRATDIQLTEPRELGSFDLSSPLVQGKLAEMYGDSIPLQEPVVAPSDLINSPLLKKVYEGR